MTKPKFTPDPPPYLQGMDVDKAFPLFVDWAMRQNNRIEDWWPKDFENRIQALERLSPYCIGEWIIADAAHVSFLSEVVSGYTSCDASWASSEVITGTADFDGIGACLSADADFEAFLTGTGATTEELYPYTYSGSWTRGSAITKPVEASEGWGTAVDHSETESLMVVGAPNTDQGGQNIGKAFIYSGSIAGGFTYGTTLTPNTVQGEGKFGTGVAISEDGEVVAIGAPGTDGATSVQRIEIYDRDTGTSFSYRNTIVQNDSDNGFGGKLALNSDGSILIVGDRGYGTGTTGRVYVYDDSGGTYTLRQTIDVPDFTENGIPGGAWGANALQFGSDVAISVDERSLIVGVTGYTFDFGSNNGAVFVFKLNEFNEYEYCDYLVGTSGSGASVEIEFTDTVKKFLSGASGASSGGFTSNGRIEIWTGTV